MVAFFISVVSSFTVGCIFNSPFTFKNTVVLGNVNIKFLLFCSFSFTVTTHVALFPPELAVIVAFPAFIPLIFPFASTVAILALLVLNVIFLFVALLGVTVATKANFSLSFICADDLFKVIC